MNGRHLSLVGDTDTHVGASDRRKPLQADDGQLRLDLGEERARFFFIAPMDQIHGSTLVAIIDELQPVVVLDLRHAVRFDVPGISRKLFFEHLSKTRSSYMHSPLAWHELDIKPITTESNLPHRLRYEAIERWKGNLLVLVPKVEHVRHIASALNMALSEDRPNEWKIQQVI